MVAKFIKYMVIFLLGKLFLFELRHYKSLSVISSCRDVLANGNWEGVSA